MFYIFNGSFLDLSLTLIVGLNNKLGVTERVQGGFFTALIDEESAGSKFEVHKSLSTNPNPNYEPNPNCFEVPPGLTKIQILDYSITEHVNVEAQFLLAQ